MKTHSSLPKQPGNTHVTNCLNTKSKGGSTYDPPNQHYKSLAKKHEHHKHNNNVFNGKNISDHTRASRFYQHKAKPDLKLQEEAIVT